MTNMSDRTSGILMLTCLGIAFVCCITAPRALFHENGHEAAGIAILMTGAFSSLAALVFASIPTDKRESK